MQCPCCTRLWVTIFMIDEVQHICCFLGQVGCFRFLPGEHDSGSGAVPAVEQSSIYLLAGVPYSSGKPITKVVSGPVFRRSALAYFQTDFPHCCLLLPPRRLNTDSYHTTLVHSLRRSHSVLSHSLVVLLIWARYYIVFSAGSLALRETKLRRVTRRYGEV